MKPSVKFGVPTSIMDVSKVKECFLSIAGALLHAGAPVKVAGRREHTTECTSVQGKAAKKSHLANHCL